MNKRTALRYAGTSSILNHSSDLCFTPSVLSKCRCPRTPVFYWWSSAAVTNHGRSCRVCGPTALLSHRVFTGLVPLISPKPVCVPSKRANLPQWLHWPQAIDYTPSRVQCHWNTGCDQMLHPGSALIPPPLNPPHLFHPLCSAVWKIGSGCCCSFPKQKWTCFHVS